MIRCLFVDDEPYALELLAKYAAEFSDMQVVAQCRSVREALAMLQAHDVDLLFLDVKMPEISGMEFLEQGKPAPAVILTTAYREYAVQAYDFGVLDYLLKPISFLRFAKAVDRYRSSAPGNTADKLHVPIVIKSGFEYHKILPGGITYIKSMKEYVSIVCANGKYLTRSSMPDILKQLPAGAFIQVHKSYIVPVGGIVSVAGSDITLAGEIKIPVGRSFLKIVRQLFPVPRESSQ